MRNTKAREASVFLSELIPQIIRSGQIEFLAKQEITHLQFLTLIAISSYSSCSMSQLAQSMKMSYPQATGIVDRLIKIGLVKRGGLSGDRRIVLIALTTKGLKFIAQFKTMLQLRWERIFNAMEEEELSIFLKSLKKIAAKVREGR